MNAFAGHAPDQIIVDVPLKYKNLAMEIAVHGFLGLPRIGE